LISNCFDLDHGRLAADPRFAELAAELAALSPIDSNETFNRYCREACRVWQEQFAKPVGEAAEFAERLVQPTIPTSWGGVIVTLHEPPRVKNTSSLGAAAIWRSKCTKKKTNGSRSGKVPG
jgi:hypothetical protein